MFSFIKIGVRGANYITMQTLTLIYWTSVQGSRLGSVQIEEDDPNHISFER